MLLLNSSGKYKEKCLILFCGRFNADTAYYEKYKIEVVAKLERSDMDWYVYDNKKQEWIEFSVLIMDWKSNNPASWWQVDELKVIAALAKAGYILESFRP